MINESKVIKKSSKSCLIIFPKMCNVMDYITKHNLCHVISNELQFVSNLPSTDDMLG